jgi:hypothetical protein
MIKVITSYTATVPTGHPLLEAQQAKEVCDRLKADGTADYEITTVAPDAAAVYEYYGRNVLGLDVHFFVEGQGEVTLDGMFETFNRAHDFIEQVGIDNA